MHREGLERIRDERAEQLGRLTFLGATISTDTLGTGSPLDGSILMDLHTILARHVNSSPNSSRNMSKRTNPLYSLTGTHQDGPGYGQRLF